MQTLDTTKVIFVSLFYSIINSHLILIHSLLKGFTQKSGIPSDSEAFSLTQSYINSCD